MPTFHYRAMTKTGQIVRNTVEDSSKFSCIKKLKRNGLVPIRVEQTIRLNKETKTKNINRGDRKNSDSLYNQAKTSNLMDRSKNRATINSLNKAIMMTERITIRDVTIFTQNFYLLKKANFNNVHALQTVINSTENPKFKLVLQDILAGVEAGEFMYTTMEFYSNIFPFIYVNMIKVGELSGSLSTSLEQAVKYLDESTALTNKIKKIIIPNVLQFFGILLILIVGTLVAIPAIQNVFDEIGTQETLPPITIWFAGVLDQFIAYWYIPTIIIVAIVGLIIGYINTPKGKYNFDYFKYSMPVFGKLIYLLDFSRFMKAVLLNLQNGMRIQDALEVSKNVAKNIVMLSMIERSINNIFMGQSWIEPFETVGFGSSMITEMLKIGMQTDLTEMIEKLLEYIDTDIDNNMQKIMKVLPEISYSIVGIVLIFMVVVVLVPCIEVYMGQFMFSAVE